MPAGLLGAGSKGKPQARQGPWQLQGKQNQQHREQAAPELRAAPVTDSVVLSLSGAEHFPGSALQGTRPLHYFRVTSELRLN